MYEGGRDNYAHFFISKYAWQYPKLFLDHWGKPVFTLITSPFAQLGIRGMIFFNILIGIITLFVLYQILDNLGFHIKSIPVLFLAFSPVYFVMLFSAMTEHLAALILTSALLLFLLQKYNLAAVTFSSLVLVRTETYIFYPLLIGYLILLRKYKSVPLLFLFPLIYSFIGYFVYDDFFWLLTKNPYSGNKQIYGSGPLFHFLFKSPVIFGWPFLLFISIGIVFFVHQILTRKITDHHKLYTLILVHVLWISLLAAHSVAYWLGNKASLGLIRVITPVIPMAAISAAIGLEQFFLRLSRYFFNKKTLLYIGAAVLSLFQILQPWIRLPLPYKYNETDKTLLAALEGLKKYDLDNSRIIYFDVFVPFYLRMDPYNSLVCREGFGNKQNPHEETLIGDLILYDNRFAPNEGGVELNSFMQSLYFELLEYYEPIVAEKTLNGFDYGVYIFKRVNERKTDNSAQLEKLKSLKYQNPKLLYKSDAYLISDSAEYFLLVDEYLHNAFWSEDVNILQVFLDLSGYSGDLSRVEICVSFEKNDTIIAFFSVPILHFEKNRTFEQYIKAIKADRLKVFIWNKDKRLIQAELKNVSVTASEKVY